MLDIIILILLCRANYKNAAALGKEPEKYIGFTILFFFGLGIAGAVLSAIIPRSYFFYDPVAAARREVMENVLIRGLAYVGGFISYRLAKKEDTEAGAAVEQPAGIAQPIGMAQPPADRMQALDTQPDNGHDEAE